MKSNSSNALDKYDMANRIIRSATVFFVAMMITYLLCLSVYDNSVWFCLAFAIAEGVLALCAYDSVMSDGEDGQSKKGNFYVWMSALMAFFAITICYMGLGVYPFGEKSVMIIDMHHQYSAFFSLLREKITTFGSLTYSDSVGLGSGFIPLIAYYLCSPYNIIAIIFPREYLTEAIALIEMLKIASAGATFSIFCRGVFKKNDYGNVALSVAYALSAYFIAYSWNVMWLDCLVLLPLIVYGLEKVIKGESPLLYCISLGVAIVTNYYIGYMLCIFMVLWFVMKLFLNSPYAGVYDVVKKVLRFAWTSIVGGMLSMWILIPTAISLRNTSGADDEFAREVTNNFNFWDIFSRTLYNNSPTERGDNLPNIYCSILAVFMIAVFCFCRKIKLKTRVGYMGLLAALVIAMSNNWLNFAFHGFHFPNDLPYRNSFLLSFVMLAIAAQALDRLKDIDSSTVAKAFALTAGLIVLEEQIGDNGADYSVIWYSLGFLCIYAAISALKTSGRLRNVTALIAITVVVFTEVSTNAVSMITQLNDNEYFTNRSDFVVDYEVDDAVVSYVESINTDGSRMEILPRKTCNDNALFGYSGLSVFASSNAEVVTTMMGNLGYAINGVNSYLYHSYVPLIDSIMNLKYVAFDHDIGTHSQLSYIDTVTDDAGNERYIYENTLSLSRGFAVSSNILYWSTDNTNPFEVQDEFLAYAAGCEGVYTMLAPETLDSSNMSVEFTDSYFYASLDDSNSSGTFTAQHIIQEETQTYIYVDCRAASSISVTVDGSSWSVTTYEPYIIDLGKLSVGTEIIVQISSDISCSGNIYIASMDTDNLNAGIAALGESQWNITDYSDGYFEGDITVDEDCVMFTSIPYDSGWDIYVDGVKTEAVKIGDALIGVNLTAGTHTVEMKYHTDGFGIGIVLSLLAVIILVLWYFRRKAIYPLLKEYVPVLYPILVPVEEAIAPDSEQNSRKKSKRRAKSGVKRSASQAAKQSVEDGFEHPEDDSLDNDTELFDEPDSDGGEPLEDEAPDGE